jgi:4-amino-4-deoxychorismate lyase
MRPRLIETLRVDADGRMPLLPWHLERLGHSCTELDYHWSIDRVQRAIARAAAGLSEGSMHRLRVLVSDNGDVDIDASVLDPLHTLPWVGLAPTRLDSREVLLRHKTTHRPWYDDTQAWCAAHADYFDLLHLNERDELCEGSRTNVYVLTEDGWLTPPVDSGVLPGVQRAALLDEEKVKERVLSLDDLQSARGLRLSNALRGWFDVRFV